MIRPNFSLIALVTAFVWASVAQAGEEGVVTRKSKLTLTGRFHVQFQTTSVEDYEPASTFDIRRARIDADFSHGALRGRIQCDFGGGSAVARDAYIDWELADAVGVKMGQYKMPFSLWELTSSAETMVIEWSNMIMGVSTAASFATNKILITDGGWAGRDIGVQVHGESGRLSWAAGIFNGNGLNMSRDDDSGKTFAGRLVVEATGRLSIGGAVSNRMYGDYVQYTDAARTDSTISDENFYAVEVDADYGIGANVEEEGVWLQAEVDYGKNPAFDTDTRFLGFVGVVGYNIPTPNSSRLLSVRPAFRFDWAKRDTGDDDSATILLTPGIDFFMSTYNRFQVNLDISVPHDDDLDTEYGLRTQFQMMI